MAKTKKQVNKKGSSSDSIPLSTGGPGISGPGVLTGVTNVPSSTSESNDRLPTVGLPLSEEKGFSGENSSILSSEEVAPMDVDSLADSSSTISENVLNNESRDHYDNVPLVDSRESHGQSTRVDFDTAIKQRSIFDASHNNFLGSDKRRYLSCEIASLKNQLFNAVMQGITHDDTTEEAKRLTAVTLKLEKAEKAFKMLFGQETTLVPGETPLFQWKGHVFNKNKPIFRTVEDCLDQFERVLFAHQLSLEDNWRRLVPARLSTSMARWYAQYLSHSQFESWSRFRLEVSNKYGKSQHNIKEEAREKLEHLLYDKSKSFESFIENFQELKSQAEITDEDCLVRYLFKALPRELTRATKFYLNNNTDKGKITADFAIEKVVATFEALFKEQWEENDELITRKEKRKKCFSSYQ
ncbi:hypothetical protein [Parasitella parasitica]|uniref:Retrotransposon gag domain-containing protein n=2 Tax=Parasitella parasitica TaxID=35722 RepID=A0A0B7NCS5_9FUNG|nr:hypothetical protein [Parasitella parasitica]